MLVVWTACGRALARARIPASDAARLKAAAHFDLS
jgi:hypothetical protein